MDTMKFFAILCSFLLIICLTLSITCLVVMRNAVQETSFWQERAEALANELDGCVQAMKEMEEEDIPVLSPDENENENNKATARYSLRLEGDTLCIYDVDGYLLKVLETRATLLPLKEREKLAAGILAESWSEVESLLQDYE